MSRWLYRYFSSSYFLFLEEVRMLPIELGQFVKANLAVGPNAMCDLMSQYKIFLIT